jgi:nicotinate-nucleotide--dimethylbenzimidazole phosphoribosyltransferase
MITNATLQRRLDTRTKPQGSLGALESLALRIGLALDTETPKFGQPQLFVFAGDHGIATDGVSAYPQAVTGQMLLNYLQGGAAINVLARQQGITLRVVDAGVASDIGDHANLAARAVARGTRNFRIEPAMTTEQCAQALDTGKALAKEALQQGSNALLFGEMGIGNTACASMLLHRRTGWSLEDCVGRGTGLDDVGLARKRERLAEASARCPGKLTPMETLTEFGGFELAMITGALLATADQKCIAVIDGFAVSVAALLAIEIDPRVRSRCVYSHCSAEHAHRKLLAHLDVRPLLDLGMRLGEGTGAALAWPLIDAAARLMTEMASFESAGVADRSS